jgi:hypothetical protein
MSELAIKLLSDAGSDALDDEGVRETYRRRGYLCLTGALSAAACREVIESLRGASMIDVRSQDLRGNSRFLTLNGGDLVSRVQWLRDDYLNLARKVSQVVGEPVVGLDNEGRPVPELHAAGGGIRSAFRSQRIHRLPISQ